VVDNTNPGTWHSAASGDKIPLYRLCWVWDPIYDRAVMAKFHGDGWIGPTEAPRVIRPTHWMTIPVPEKP
jgi:hypothetical protein